MKLRDFKVEQWMNEYEGRAVYNMTDTCVSPFTLQQLLEMDQDDLMHDLKLDYGTITGDVRLKEEIAKLYTKGTINGITMAQGCLQANEMVMETLLEAGDTVLVYTPSYQQFTDIPVSIGCEVIQLPLYEEDGWQPRIKDLEEAFRHSVKLVIINQPNNPTGTILKQDYLDKLIELALSQGIYILADEVYRSPNETSISDLYEKGISTASLSKLFSLAGLRLGWVKGPQEVIDAINVRRDYTIISTGPLSDTLGLIALRHADEILDRADQIITGNKKILQNWINQEEAVSIVMPSAGTVGFLKYDLNIDSAQLAEDLLDQYGVFFVPGSCFGCEHHLRIGLTQKEEIFKTGLDQFSQYIQKCKGNC